MEPLQRSITSIARLLAVSVLAVTAVAQQPIPAGPDAPTRKDYLEAEYAFHKRTIYDAYGQVGSRHERWDALAERFLFLMTDFLANRPGALTHAQLATAAKAAIDAGCDDPMALYWYGHCLRRTDRNQEAETALRRAYDNFVPSGYAVAYRCWAGDPGTDPWTARMIAGRLHLRLAWHRRSGARGSDVTKEGWEGFSHHLEQARVALTEAWELNPQMPEAATEMITVTMARAGRRGDGPRVWFDRAVQAQLDYLPAYRKLRWALRPRWGGSHEAIYSFGIECLKSERFDTHVPYELFLALQDIVSDADDYDAWYSKRGVYEDVLAMIDGYLGEPSMSTRHHWYRSLGVALAWRCGRWQDAQQALDNLGRDADPDAFRRLDLDVDDAVSEILVRGADPDGRAGRADALADDGQFDEALKLYDELRKQGADVPSRALFVRRRIGELEFQRDFAGDGWVDIQPGHDLDNWQVQTGQWTVHEDGTLVGTSAKQGLFLTYEYDLGARFEVRGQIRFVKSPYSKFNAGIYFGSGRGKRWHAYRMYEIENFAALYDTWGKETRSDVAVEGVNTFSLMRWDQTLHAHLNDQPTHEQYVMQIGADGRLGIGGRYWYDGAVLQFTNLQVRALRKEPRNVPDPEPEPDG